MTTLSLTQSAFTQPQTTVIKAMMTLQRWMDRHSERKQLAQLDDHMLQDLGLTRHQALTEASKPFWK